MEKFDPNRELQVWQRVAEAPKVGGGDIRPLLLLAWEQASVLRHLSLLLPLRLQDRMKAAYGGSRRTVEALKGIQVMSGHPAGNLRNIPIPKEPARRLLEKSFHRALRLMTEYTARSLDPEFGVIYQGLADREREMAIVLAELIGGVER